MKERMRRIIHKNDYFAVHKSVPIGRKKNAIIFTLEKERSTLDAVIFFEFFSLPMGTKQCTVNEQKEGNNSI